MTDRPNLDKNLDSKTFCDYYYLKEELVDFCRKNGLSISGGKIEITNRIACFLDTGERLSAPPIKKKATAMYHICEDTKIESDFVCSENHRTFFKKHIGSSFSFNVTFHYIRDFFADNRGNSLEDAIRCWKYKKQIQGHNRYEKVRS